MKKNGKKLLTAGGIMLLLFTIWTGLIQTVDVQPAGQNGTDIGFAGVNTWFHRIWNAWTAAAFEKKKFTASR